MVITRSLSDLVFSAQPSAMELARVSFMSRRATTPNLPEMFWTAVRMKPQVALELHGLAGVPWN